jgi:hypothetical protein
VLRSQLCISALVPPRPFLVRWSPSPNTAHGDERHNCNERRTACNSNPSYCSRAQVTPRIAARGVWAKVALLWYSLPLGGRDGLEGLGGVFAIAMVVAAAVPEVLRGVPLDVCLLEAR